MLDFDLDKLDVEDVDSLSGFSLNIAFAIYFLEWRWHKHNSDKDTIYLLKKINNCNYDLKSYIYIGDKRYVSKELPRFSDDITYMLYIGNSLRNKGLHGIYMDFLEDELNSNHFRIAHATAEKRCKAALKTFIYMKSQEKKCSSKQKK